MRNARRWTDQTRVGLQTVLLAGCCVIAFAVRALVDADTLSDPIELALNAGALVFLLAAAALSALAVRATRVPALRAIGTLMATLAVCLTATFVRLTYADVSIELADLIEPAQAAEGPSQIVVGPTGQDVRLSGDIKDGAADLLDKILAAHPSIRRIALTSDGGVAEEGQALAEVIAAHRLTTYVPDYCVSACTLAFAGGHERILMEGARLGFHAPYQQGLLGQTFVGDAKEQRAAYIKAGLSSGFVDQALKVAPDDIWVPERDQLLAAHVATGIVDRYRFPDSILDGVADGQGARDAVLRNFQMLASLDADSPHVIDRIAGWYLDAYRRGASEGEATDGLTKIVNATLTLVLVRADDATLIDLARLMQAAARAKASVDDCEMIRTVDLVRAVAVLGDADKTVAQRAASLVDRALTAGRRAAQASHATPIAFGSHRESCAAMRTDDASALERRDPSPLRHRLQEAAPDAARLLAPLAKAGP